MSSLFSQGESKAGAAPFKKLPPSLHQSPREGGHRGIGSQSFKPQLPRGRWMGKDTLKWEARGEVGRGVRSEATLIN